MAESISILGCGWLGFPLAEELNARGFSVKGSTRTPEKVERLRQAGIDPFLLDLTPELSADVPDSFFDSDHIVIDIPPGRARENVEEFHTQQIRSLVPKLQSDRVRQVLFVSSTGVYPSLNRVVTEADAGEAERGSGRAVFQAEEILRESIGSKLCVVRFGGLLGGDRHPARFLARKEYLTDADTPINLIGRDDCIGILSLILERSIVADTFNACCDEHPTRREFYERESAKLGIDPPKFTESEVPSSWKIVSSEKLKRELGYKFIHPNPSDVFA